MVRRAWLMGMLSATLLAGQAAAQDEYDLKVPDRNLVLDIRKGAKPLRDAGGSIPADHQKAIDAVANYTMLRITSEVNRRIKPGQVVEMADLVRQAADYMLEVPAPPKKLSESQRDYMQVYGKACLERLRPIFGTAEKPSKFEPIVRVNAARLLSLVARMGYEESADVAIAVIENPKEIDAVRFWALQALRNLFTAVNPDFPEKSVVTKADRELKAVQALIGFISRKVKTDDMPPEEAEAVRYVRREAIRALGHVRKPIYRTEGKIVAIPALWLLRVAAADPVLSPLPNVSERVEGAVSYLQLNPDRTENTDYAVFYLGKMARDLAKDFSEKQDLKIDPKEKPKELGTPVSQRDYYAWKAGMLKLEMGLKDWKAAWDADNPTPPQPAGRLMTELVANVVNNICEPIQGINAARKQIDGSEVDRWVTDQLSAGLFANASLFKDDPTATVALSIP